MGCGDSRVVESVQSSGMNGLQCATLHTGAKMPIVGFGTFLSKDTGQLVKQAVLGAGYRHIDTAAFYNNEEQVGEALHEIFASDKGIKREDIFITTKLQQKEKYDPKAALKQSLKKLRIDYVDLYLIHFPENPVIEHHTGKKEFAKIPLHKLWKQLEECVHEGLTKHIGISNFTLQLTLDLLTYCEIRPAVNQIELHPYLAQYNLVEYLKKEGIVVTAYCPIGAPGRDPSWGQLKNEIIADPEILKLAKKYKRTPAQIVLNWGIQRGHVIIPKSSSLTRMIENYQSQNFKLSKKDVELITALNKNDRIVDPKFWDFELNVPIFA